jgi:hypothetical protein
MAVVTVELVVFPGMIRRRGIGAFGNKNRSRHRLSCGREAQSLPEHVRELNGLIPEEYRVARTTPTTVCLRTSLVNREGRGMNDVSDSGVVIADCLTEVYVGCQSLAPSDHNNAQGISDDILKYGGAGKKAGDEVESHAICILKGLGFCYQ